MSNHPLLGKKTAILVANGFSEQDLIKSQRAIQKLGGDTRIVSMDQGLVNSWNGNEWGLNFAADQSLNKALAADYDFLVIPGGQKSMDKLKLTAHTRRFINGFLGADKPVVAVNEALDILVFTELLNGRAVVDASCDSAVVQDGNFLSCTLDDDSEAVVIGAVTDLLMGRSVVAEEREAVAA